MDFDPTLRAASSMTGTPDGYSILVGSGISRGSGILTGWEIAIDLIRTLAVLEGQSDISNPLEWYSSTHDSDVDYSKLLEALAPSLGDRQQRISKYFEASDEDREAGRKEPSEAHRAIADLVATNIVRVIITTNFDRFFERAIQDRGIEPTVVSNSDQVRDLPPLHLVRCLIIKLNGDLNSPNIKNTLLELSAYEDPIKGLLAQVLTDRGLIVCGWSAEWDHALVSLLHEYQSRFFSTFWAYRGDLSENAEALIRSRSAIPIAIEDANGFFSDLASKSQAIRDLEKSSFSSKEVAASELKRLMTDERQRIRLYDLVLGSVRTGLTACMDSLRPFEGTFQSSEYSRRLDLIEHQMGVSNALLSTLAFHGDNRHHTELLFTSVKSLVAPHREYSGLTVYLELQLYPALLGLYAIGLASIASGRLDALAKVLADVTVPNVSRTSKPIAVSVCGSSVLDSDAVKTLPGMGSRQIPSSDLLHSRLRPYLSPLIPDDDQYDETFDDFEYLIGLVHFAITDNWGPIGRFLWRRQYAERGARDAILNTATLPLLAAGVFGGEASRLEDVHVRFESFLDGFHLR